ncbi:uncharacterized protein UV8b_00707 [Ustilaginoidea virens]|uniref:Uncharacterized protein n=1 Tax=Ustilaginoidea virens TaxID=1159556 RepID=A0A8E5HJ91_USTVR|nr:uncharacterized protein UV8b_00707 [Ustilaginoidea virens]QUC16466.1 hypothetical protein UV8b_00707 [Ustilaginoidea virens]
MQGDLKVEFPPENEENRLSVVIPSQWRVVVLAGQMEARFLARRSKNWRLVPTLSDPVECRHGHYYSNSEMVGSAPTSLYSVPHTCTQIMIFSGDAHVTGCGGNAAMSVCSL